MEEYISIDDYISATGRLYQYSQNKRLHVAHNKFVNDSIGQIAIYINQVIKTRYGVDIFNDSSKEHIQKYEDMLTKTISEYTTRMISRRDVTDETEILKKSVIIDNGALENKEISVSLSLQDHIESFPLNSNELIDLCKKPTILSSFNGYSKDSRENYILISTAVLKECPYHVVIHLSNESGKNNELSISTVFLLTSNNLNKYIENPVMAFLSQLDIYGLDININEKTKKLFGKEIVELPKEFDGKLNFVNILNVSKMDKYTLSLSLKLISNKCIEMEFVYGINYTKYLLDLKEIINNIKSS